ncbi:hypothetical protein [Acinetobacter gerneri]|uniref:hypothetical protein n=1 Tax=Acinetobacter gerneri TaxID=202952 RepID=UPI003A84A12E
MIEHLPFHIYTVGKTEQVTNELEVIVAVLPSKAVRQDMEITQYLGPREQRETDEATAELGAFVADFMSDDQADSAVTWDDIEIKAELPATVVQGMPFRTACDVLDEYSNRASIKQSIIEARKIEVQATDINCFDSKPEFNSPHMNKYFKIKKPRITAVIDWLRLEILISEGYKFKRPTQPYNDIKDFLKAKSINDNPYVKQTGGRTFELDLHDVSTGNDYTDILNKLRAEYEPRSIKVVTLEVSLDFWNVSASSFLLALQKSLRVDKRFENTDLRAYNDDKGSFLPTNSVTAMKRVHDGHTIGIGHKHNGDLYVRTYYKVKDRGQALPRDQYRTRIEINVRGETLVSMGNDADNLKHLTNKSFKFLRFTHLKDDATPEQIAEYRKFVGLFGKEISVISKSRNKRPHPDHIESYAKLNKVVSTAVSNLIRNL